MMEIQKLTLCAEKLLSKNLTIAVAESCTSGLIQNMFSRADFALSFFQGGITVYNIGQKSKHLNINPIVAESCNAVSHEIADKMAHEVALMFNAEIGIAITGYAKPIPEKGIEDCYAFISICENAKLLLSKRIKGDRCKSMHENQVIFMEKMFEELLRSIQ